MLNTCNQIDIILRGEIILEGDTILEGDMIFKGDIIIFTFLGLVMEIIF